jgi:hypothetical protein
MDYKYAIAIKGEVDSVDVWNDIASNAPFDAYVTSSGWTIYKPKKDDSIDLAGFAQSRWFALEFYIITRLRSL